MQVLRYRCTDEVPCEGLGDRIVGLNLAFWLVLPSEPLLQLTIGFHTSDACRNGSAVLGHEISNVMHSRMASAAFYVL